VYRDPADGKSVSRSANILVVDDEESINRLLRHTINSLGHRVESTTNPEEALGLIAKKRFDLILMDIRLPGMSGLELYSKLKDNWPDLAKRVVFITGDATSTDTRAFLAQTGVPYFTKPFDLQTLRRQLQLLLDRNMIARE
jgi:CheY-like chemotaxis protein